ncbi:MAG: hypothetical protein WC829_10735 [Hyphomicrobium sp.]
MNILKGLDDASLQSELQAPSGAAPPFLVATEIGRRKDMRQRYEGEQARRKPSTTVVEDLTAGAPTPPMQPEAPMGGTGIEAAGPAPIPGFADGGLIDYDEIASRYNERLAGLGGDKDRARAMALLAAGAGIMGAGNSNTLQNIGVGASAGINAYSDAIKATDSEELALLRGITDIGQLQHQDELARMDQAYRERSLTSQEARDAARLSFEKTPAAVLTTEWLAKQDPETQKLYMDTQRAQAGLFGPDRMGAEFSSIEDQVRRDLKDADPATPKVQSTRQDLWTPEGGVDPQKVAAAQMDYAHRIVLETYARIKNSLGVEAAARYAQQAGISEQERLAIDTGVAAPVSGAFTAPGKAVSYADYF